MALALAALTISPAPSALGTTFPPKTASHNGLPGYKLVQQNCMKCHSTHSVKIQVAPSRAYWEKTVRKMKKSFGAQFPDEDIPMMVDYLAKAYGAERGAQKSGQGGG